MELQHNNPKVTVTPTSSVYVQVVTDSESTTRELRNYFTFEDKKAYFKPSFKNKMWDGKVRLLTSAGRLYRGLAAFVEKFCNDRQYEFASSVEDIGFSIADAEKFIDKLKVFAGGEEITPYNYQRASFLEFCKTGRALIQSPTGSGKSLIIYLIMLWLMKATDKKVLIIVPKLNLIDQLTNDFLDYSNKNEWLAGNIHLIFGGKLHKTPKRIVISTWQSIYKNSPDWYSQFGCIIADECHMYKSDSLKGIMEKTGPVPYKVGLTGTLDDVDCHRLILQGLFAPVYVATTTEEEMESGRLARLKIKNVILRYSPTESELVCKMDYESELQYILSHDVRNRLLVNLVKGLSGNTLVLFRRVDAHGTPLFDQIRKKCLDKEVFLIYGDIEPEERERVRQLVETKKNAVIVASYGTYSVGVNIKNLNNVVFSSPSKSKIEVLQSIGRSLRVSKTKSTATLYDIVDNFSHGKKQNYVLQHFQDRVNYYAAEGHAFDFSTVNVPQRTAEWPTNLKTK